MICLTHYTRRALERPQCRKYVGENAYQALRKLWDNRRITYFHGVAFDWRGPAFAQTWVPLFEDEPRTTLSYSFFQGRVDDEATYFGIERIQRQAATLLHEARHALCPGCGYIEDHDNWTPDIINNCFK